MKYIELSGIRFGKGSGKKPEVKFIYINHASSPLDAQKAQVTLWASTKRSEEDMIGTFSVTLPALAPNEFKELTAPFETKLKIYELPDWQNAIPEIQIK